MPEQQLGQISTIQSELISNYKADARQLNIKNIESQSHILEYRQKLFEFDDTPIAEDPGNDGEDDSDEDDNTKQQAFIESNRYFLNKQYSKVISTLDKYDADEMFDFV